MYLFLADFIVGWRICWVLPRWRAFVRVANILSLEEEGLQPTMLAGKEMAWIAEGIAIGNGLIVGPEWRERSKAFLVLACRKLSTRFVIQI